MFASSTPAEQTSIVVYPYVVLRIKISYCILFRLKIADKSKKEVELQIISIIGSGVAMRLGFSFRVHGQLSSS